MKLIYILFFVSLLFATNCFTKSNFCEAADSATNAVRDSTGKILRPGTYYYIQPIYPDEAGGFEIASISNHGKPCPLGIVQENYYPGDSVLFSSANSKKNIIRLSTDLNIEYNSTYTVCTESHDIIWTVGPYDRRARSYFIVVDGVEKGNPGRETIKNWFKIEEFGDNYKIAYCPSVCRDRKVMCKDVGVIEYNGQKRLGLTDVPVEVKFVKYA